MLQHLKGPRQGLRAACAFAILLVACPLDPPPPPPRLEVFPSRVQLPANRLVEVTIAAHVRGSDGVVSTAAPIGWTKVGGPVPEIGFPGSGGRIVVTVKPGLPQGSRFTLQASDGTRTDIVEFEILAPIGLNLDQADAVHRVADPPAAAVLTALLGTCWVDSVFPFAHRANLGDWGPGCPTTHEERAFVFSPERELSRWTPHDWVAGGPDIFDATMPPPALTTEAALLEINRGYPYLTVPLRIWAFQTSVDQPLKDLVLWQVTTASAVFSEALAGVTFTYTEADIQVLPGAPKSCLQLDALISNHPEWEAPGMMNVYYTPDLVWSRRGYFCGKPSPDPLLHGRPDPANRIMVASSILTSTALAHELGHATAMLEPWSLRGHVDQLDGTASDNVMWANLDNLTASTRYRFSVGQVFRINQDTRSWLNHPDFRAGAPIDCGCSPYSSGPCPRLTADVRKIGSPSATLPGGTCP